MQFIITLINIVMEIYNNDCFICKAQYTTKSIISKYCSKNCKERAYRKRIREGRKDKELNCYLCESKFIIISGSSSQRKHCYNESCSKEHAKILRKRSYKKRMKNSNNRKKHNEQTRKSQTKVRDFIAKYKTERGCVDCGYNKHFSALQLDHEGIKTLSIADARSSITRFLKEVKDGNCVVRCANCHSIKTWERKHNI